MIITVLVRFNHIDEKSAQVERVSRRTNLVVNDADRIVSLAHLEHRLDEVLAIEAEHPCNANNEILFKRPAHSEFALELGFSIDVERFVILAVRFPRRSATAVKHVVRADIDHLCINFFSDASDVFCTFSVNCKDLRLLVFIFGKVHCRPGGAMHNYVRLHALDGFGNRSRIRNIHRHIRHRRHSATVGYTRI